MCYLSQSLVITTCVLSLSVYLGTDEVLNGNCSVAQLTTKGYSQHLANGKALHEAYVSSGFLGKTLDPTEVYLRSDGKWGMYVTYLLHCAIYYIHMYSVYDDLLKFHCNVSDIDFNLNIPGHVPVHTVCIMVTCFTKVEPFRPYLGNRTECCVV